MPPTARIHLAALLPLLALSCKQLECDEGSPASGAASASPQASKALPAASASLTDAAPSSFGARDAAPERFDYSNRDPNQPHPNRKPSHFCPEGMADILVKKNGTPTRRYCLQYTEVTVEEYEKCVLNDECPHPIRGRSRKLITPECNWSRDGFENHPINCITQPDAENYCKLNGMHLPTRFELEYAVHHGEYQDYPWGNEAPDGKACWNAVSTCPVGAFPEGDSIDGVSDLAGNVLEWTTTSYQIETIYLMFGGEWADDQPSSLAAYLYVFDLLYTASPSTGVRCAMDARRH